MLSLSQINAMSREAARKAARNNKKPFIVERDDLDVMPPFPFPNIGDHHPKGWKHVETHFVDKSGWGSPSEPALTPEQFLAKLVPGRGYAIIEEGQFQVYVGEFIPPSKTAIPAP